MLEQKENIAMTEIGRLKNDIDDLTQSLRGL